MIDYSRVYTEFEQLVGFRQTQDPTIETLAKTLTSSTSGLYVNDIANNWITSKNIYYCIPDFLNFEYQSWNNTTSYSINDRVKDAGRIYISLTDSNVGNVPASDTTNWEYLFDEPSLNTWLKTAREAAIKEVLNNVLEHNNEMNASKTADYKSFGTLIDNDIEQVYEDLGNTFVGYIAYPKLRDDVRLELRKIGLKCDTAQTLTLRVFHSSQTESIATYPIEVTEVDKFVWYDIEAVLDYHQNNKDAGGKFYIGFFTSEITGNISSYKDDTWGSGYYPRFRRYKEYFNFMKLRVEERYLNGINRFDLDFFDEPDDAYFNLDVVAYSDQTYSVLAGKKMWYRTLQLAIAYKILSEMYQSSELTRIAEYAQKEIGFLLFGNKERGIDGVQERYFTAIKKLIQEYQNSDGWENNTYLKMNFH